MNKEIWLLCSLEEGRLDEWSLELIGAASTLQQQNEGYSYAAVFFDSEYDASHYGCARSYCLSGAGSEADSRGRLLAEAIRRFRPEMVFAPSTGTGRAICSIAAALVGTGLTADCTGLSLKEDGVLSQTRPALGGGLIADIICPVKRPQMATLKLGAFPPALPRKIDGKNLRFEFTPKFEGSRLLEETALTDGPQKLQTSRIILSGGLGIGSAENFRKLEGFADAIGAGLAASRGAVNAGYAPYYRQVGLSGLSVKPDIYIALGISGAAQHLAGIRMAGKIIAVNTDSKAPIFRFADVGILADWGEYIELLVKEYLTRKG